MNNTSNLETVNGGKTDKLKRYGWVIKDAPGEMKFIKKTALRIPDEYQRDLNNKKAQDYASAWSWFGCAVIVVARRHDGALYIVDGQHRHSAAMRRSDIDVLPCIVFECESISDEAKAFITCNTSRKSMSSIEKLKGLTASGDEIASYVTREFDRLGLVIKKTATKAMEIKCIAVCQKLAGKDRQSFSDTLELCCELSRNEQVPISERVLFAIEYINQNTDEGINNKRLRKRIIDVGHLAILNGANKASAYFSRGGEKVWAEGAISTINKGLRIPFSLVEKQ